MDGYVLRDGELYQPEAEILDVEAEKGLLEKLHVSLGLASRQEAFEFLKLAENHYVAGRWSDCIGNARKFFEVVLQQVAVRHAGAVKKSALGGSTIERPVAVRDYLEKEGMLEKKEREAVDKTRRSSVARKRSKRSPRASPVCRWDEEATIERNIRYRDETLLRRSPASCNIILFNSRSPEAGGKEVGGGLP